MLKKMGPLNNLRKKETILTLGEDEVVVEMVRSSPCFYDKTWKEHKERKNKSLKCKKETIKEVILFKHYMLSPSVKCISQALHIICVIKKWLGQIKINSKTLKYEKGVTCWWIWKCDWNN